MYTRCPQCGTIFRISFEQLRAAQGSVHCGVCTATFSALESLSDEYDQNDVSDNEDTNDLPVIAVDQDAPVRDELPEELEPETGPEPEPGDQEKEVPAEDPADPEDSLEFNIPRERWESFFTPDATIVDESENGFSQETVDSMLDRETSDIDEWRSFLDEGQADSDDEDEERPVYVVATDDKDDRGSPADLDETGGGNFIYQAPEDAAPADSGKEQEDDFAEDDFDTPVYVVETDTDDVPVASYDDQPDNATDSDISDVPAPWDHPETGTDAGLTTARVSWKRMAATVVLAAALVVQLVHYNRDALAAHPAYGSAVRMIYGFFSADLYPDWNLDAYSIRSQEAIGSLSARGALNILAKIEITGQQSVDPPLVRVRLLDRWGKPVGSRVFDPPEYRTDNGDPYILLSPGTLIPMLVRVADPGIEAQGYEIDVCLPNRHIGLRCQRDFDPFQP